MSSAGPYDGLELWGIDRDGNFYQLSDIGLGEEHALPTAISRLGDGVFIFANDRRHGREPWLIDLATPESSHTLP